MHHNEAQSMSETFTFKIFCLNMFIFKLEPLSVSVARGCQSKQLYFFCLCSPSLLIKIRKLAKNLLISEDDRKCRNSNINKHNNNSDNPLSSRHIDGEVKMSFLHYERKCCPFKHTQIWSNQKRAELVYNHVLSQTTPQHQHSMKMLI